MVFGQPRQDDLLEYLLRRLHPDQLSEELQTLRIDLSPPGSKAATSMAGRSCPSCSGVSVEQVDIDDAGSLQLLCGFCGNEWREEAQVESKKRGAATARGKSWSESRFFEKLQERAGADVVPIARSIYEWAQDHGMNPNWSPGTTSD